MTTSQQTAVSLTTEVAELQTPAAAGELRQLLRERGWRSDLAWVEVGARSASAAVRAADGGDVRRTIAYLSGLRALDGGTRSVWKEGDVPAPAVADVREVMLATEGEDEWASERFEAPPVRVETAEQAEAAGVAA